MRFKNAKWIGNSNIGDYDCENKSQSYGLPSPYIIQDFCIQEKVKKATLYITAQGYFKPYLNGQEISKDLFTPSFTDYNKTIEYYTYEITKFIQNDNRLGIILGDGWYAGNISQLGKFNYGTYPLKTIFEIEVLLNSGKYITIKSDETALTGEGEIRKNDIQNGEYIDFTKKVVNFSSVDFDASNFISVKSYDEDKERLKPSFIQPVRFNHVLKPIFVSNDDEKTIYDFGQNLAGLVSCKLFGKMGDKVVFRYGEMLNTDGTLYTDNLRTALATDTVILDNNEQTFLPLFTFHGFRYVEISAKSTVTITEIKALSAYNSLNKMGDFTCNDKNVTKLFQNALWGQRSNFISIPMDCPQRDERLGWTGDAQVFCKSAMFNMDCQKFYSKYLRDIRETQDESGCLGNIAPFLPIVGRGFAGWCDAITIITYNHYLMYGDKNIILENLDAIKKWIGYLQNNSKDYLREEFSYGDWLSVGEETDLGVFNTAFFAYSVDLACRLCKIIGDKDADKFSALFQNIKSAFNNAYVSEDCKIKSDTQTAYLLAINFNLIDKDKVSAHLLRRIKENNNHLTCGFIGIKYLLPTLCDLGYSNIAYELLTKKSYPSWLYSVINGATTIWERWNSYTLENGFADKTMNSFNHYSLGSCVEFMYSYILGIRIDEDCVGFKKIKIKPYFPLTNEINFVSGSYDSANGIIMINWKKNLNEVVYEISYDKRISVSFDFGDYLFAKTDEKVTKNKITNKFKIKLTC